MPVELVLLLLAMTVPVAVTAAVRWRRGHALAQGRAARFRCSLSVAPGEAPGPYPPSPSRGALLVGEPSLVWHGRDGQRLDLTGTGLLAVRRREPTSSVGRQDELALVCQDGLGTNLHLQGGLDELGDLWDVLRARPLPPSPVAPTVLQPRRDSAWALRPAAALLASALLSAVLWTLFVTATPVRATVLVTGSDTDYCTVAWTDPDTGAARRNGVDCYEDVGDEERYYALAGPLRGELVHADDPPSWAGLGGTSVLGSVLWLATGLVRSRRGAGPAMRSGRELPSRSARLAGVPPLTADRCDFASVVVHARARAAAEGWSFDGREQAPDAVRTPRWARSERGRLCAALVVPFGTVLGAVALVLTLGWPAFSGLPTTWQPTATATATVEGDPVEVVPFGPVELEVRFRDGEGRSHRALVVVDAQASDVETLTVEHALGRPGAARALHDDGSPVVLALGALVVGAAAAFATWRIGTVLRVRRAEARAAAMPAREVDYVLLHSVDSDCVLVLHQPGSSRAPDRALVLLDDVRGRLPGTGRLVLRGADAPGAAVLAAHRGQPLVLGSPLLELDSDDVLALANATDLDDEAGSPSAQPKKTSASA